MAKRWRIHGHDPDSILRLERAAGIPTVIARLLICRGICDPLEARQFLQSPLTALRDPELLPGATQAAQRIAEAIARKRRIIVYGDYDADGMTATAILLLCIKLLGGNVGFYVPNRMDEGYGLSHDALESLAADGTHMVITVDCGIASVDEAQTARRLGLELIVTDHHQMADRLPEAAVLVHPRLPGHDYPFPGLSGAGVAFKVAWAICQEVTQNKKVSDAMRELLLQAVGLAAVGTVADVVPLVDENRVLVRHGLTSLAQRPTLGMAELLTVTGLHGKTQLTSEDVAYTIAPRLNAAGRLGQAQLAIELLTTESKSRATALAEYMHELNESRSTLERSVYLAAHKQAQQRFDPEGNAALVLADHGWHPGVIGIVAGRLAEKYHRPVVLIALDPLGVKPGIGSARSIPGFELHRALQSCSQHLLSHGGHAAAAGLKIDERYVDAFRDEFCQYASAEIALEDLVEELRIDAETTFGELTAQAVSQMEQLGPFGEGNGRPLLCSSNVRLAEPPKRIGGGGRHLALKLAQHNTKIRAVAFGKGDWADELTGPDENLAVAFQPVINDFRGRRSVELQLVDWQRAGGSDNGHSDHVS